MAQAANPQTKPSPQSQATPPVTAQTVTPPRPEPVFTDFASI
ncbi:MAG: hypothetical protein R3197_09605 [Paracoccaceae bacterium]|nr:hypothetical protein [Paracoccaceae bacterium]